MQEGLTFPQWAQTAIQILASAVAGGGIVRVYNSWLNRRKPAAEVHLTEATTTEVHVRAGASAGDAVMRMMDRLDAAQITIDRLRTERDAWQDEYDKVFVQRDELLRQKALMQDELESYEEQMITMRATLKANHLNYDNTQDLKLTPPDKK
jgi:hypothetical protein